MDGGVQCTALCMHACMHACMQCTVHVVTTGHHWSPLVTTGDGLLEGGNDKLAFTVIAFKGKGQKQLQSVSCP